MLRIVLVAVFQFSDDRQFDSGSQTLFSVAQTVNQVTGHSAVQLYHFSRGYLRHCISNTGTGRDYEKFKK